MRRLCLWILSLICLSCVVCSCFSQPLIRTTHEAFSSYYDIEKCNPAFVVWMLTPDDFRGVMKMKSRHFKVDTQLPPPRVKANAYSGSGYVRGHLCAAADRDTDKGLLKQTYLTSNMVPMTMVCNSGQWKQVEDTCRVIAKSHGECLMVAGCIYNDSILGLAKVGRCTVPSAFFRLAICNRHPDEVWCWIVQNSWSRTWPVRVGTKVLQQVLQPNYWQAIRSVTAIQAYPR